jgi:5-methylcytosine-specific restriction endonuclease McrA
VELLVEHPAAAAVVVAAAEKTEEVVVVAGRVAETTVAIPAIILSYLFSPGTGAPSGTNPEYEAEERHKKWLQERAQANRQVEPEAAKTRKGSKGGRTAGKRFKPSDRKKDAGKDCIYCGQETTEEPGHPNSRETDHIYPGSRGGNANDRNRAPACRTCNRSKSDRTPDEWQKAKEEAKRTRMK